LTFGEWVIDRVDVLFQPKRDPYYSLTTILHFFANRLNQSFDETRRMDEEERDEIFKLEKEILDAEIKNNK